MSRQAIAMHRRAKTLPQRWCETRRGVAAVEMGLLLPLLMLIVLGTVDFGRFSHAYIGVTNAARAGAGYGMMHPPTNATLPNWQTDIRNVVLDELNQTLTDANLTASDVTVTSARVFETGGAIRDWRVQVTVSMPFNTIVAWPTLPSNVTLSRQVEMRGIR